MKLTLCLLFRNVVLMWQPLVYNPFANTFHTTEQERWRGGGEGEILNWEIKWEILNEIDGWKTETSSEKKWMLKVMRKKWHKNRNKNRFAPEESKISFGIVPNQTLHEIKQERNYIILSVYIRSLLNVYASSESTLVLRCSVFIEHCSN